MTAPAAHLEISDDITLARARHLRVAFFSDALPERNGTGAYYNDLLQQLEPMVGKLALMQPQRAPRFPRLALPLPGDNTQHLMTPNVFRLWRDFNTLQADIVVSVTPGPFGLMGALLAHRRGCPLLTGFHTHFEALAKMYWRPEVRWIISSYLRGAARFQCARSRAVLINNSDLRDTVERLGAREVELIGTPLQSRFLETPLRGAPDKLRQVCFIGRLAAEKNIDAFIAAVHDFPTLNFVIAGDGPERARVESASAALPNLRYLGWQSREQLVALLDSSSLLVLPSNLETFGSVALEAMARGRPALVSAEAGIHDWPLLNSGLYRIERGESVSNALRRILRLGGDSLQRKSANARTAAIRLNDDTVRHWAGLLVRYAETPQ